MQWRDLFHQPTRGRAWLALTLLLSAGLPAGASTFVAMDLADLVEASEVVVTAKVVEVRSAWDPQGRIILTDAILAVDESIVGLTEDRLSVRTFGGEVEGFVVEAAGFPRFEEGEELLVFLRPEPVDGHLRVTGYQMGHFRITGEEQRKVAKPTLDPGVNLVAPRGRSRVETVGEWELESLKTEIRRIARDLPDPRNQER